MHLFYAHQNDQPAGGHLPAPDGSGNRRLRDAEKVGQIGSRMLTDNEFKPFERRKFGFPFEPLDGRVMGATYY